jgi:hypothetical protein
MGTNTSTTTGGSISYEQFWNPLRHMLAEQGWQVGDLAGFPVVAVKRDWVVGMIDAHASEPRAAFVLLNKRAQQNHVATSKLFVAVYLQTSAEVVQAVTGFKDGNRMGPQAMGAVVQLMGGQFYPPKKPEWSLLTGYSQEINYDTQVDQELREAIHRTLSPR